MVIKLNDGSHSKSAGSNPAPDTDQRLKNMSDPVMKKFIKETFVKVFDVQLEQVMYKCREKVVLVPRQAYCTAMSRFSKISLVGLSIEIYDEYSFFIDHATIINARRAIDNVYINGRVITKIDKYYAQKVQRFMALVEAEYNRLDAINKRRNPFAQDAIFIVSDGFTMSQL